jgi:hypothetical protein
MPYPDPEWRVLGMNSKDLTRNQGLQVFLETREMLHRIYALKKRMDDRGFEADDPLYDATVKAWEAFIVMNKQWQLVSLGGSYLMSATQPHDQPQPNGNERHGDQQSAQAKPPGQPCNGSQRCGD